MSKCRLHECQIYIFASQGLISAPPVHALAALFPCTATCWMLYVTSVIMIIFSDNQHKPFISPHFKLCTQLTENAKCVTKNYSMLLLQSLMENLNVSILYLHFSYQAHVFVTHVLIGCSYCWLQRVKTLTVLPPKSS